MRITLIVLSTFIFQFTDSLFAQDSKIDNDLLYLAANEIIDQAKLCALITLDSTGHPQVRTMEALPVEENFVVLLGTNKNSRKVKQIQNDSRVTVYYCDPSGNGYVVLNGNAKLVDDQNEKDSHWQDAWDQYYPNRDEIFVLIKVIPNRLEVVNYKQGVTGDVVTWRAPHINLNPEK